MGSPGLGPCLELGLSKPSISRFWGVILVGLMRIRLVGGGDEVLVMLMDGLTNSVGSGGCGVLIRGVSGRDDGVDIEPSSPGTEAVEAEAEVAVASCDDCCWDCCSFASLLLRIWSMLEILDAPEVHAPCPSLQTGPP